MFKGDNMRICSIKGCGKKYYGLGYCRNHYIHFKKYGDPLIYKIKSYQNILCSVKYCKKKYYASGYCLKHYRSLFWYPKNKESIRKYQKQYKKDHYPLKTHKCFVKNCLIRTRYKYCAKHSKRNRLHRSLDLSKKYTLKGRRNPNWKGGVSEYYNHYLMKKMRILKLQQTKGKCEICGKHGYQIHHKDNSKNNHNIENLILVCAKCHGILGRGRHNKTSKFIRLYGMTLNDMGKKFNRNPRTLYSIYRRGDLDIFLLKQTN